MRQTVDQEQIDTWMKSLTEGSTREERLLAASCLQQVGIDVVFPKPEAQNTDAEPYVDDEQPGVTAPWRPQTLEDADWCLKRLMDLQAELGENNALLEANIVRLRARTNLLNRRLERGLAFFESVLRDYAENHRGELLKGGKRKTRNLLHGSLGWRKKGGALEILDKDALLEWARGQPVESGFLRFREEVAISEVKKHAKETGEEPPGTVISPEYDEFVIKPGAEELKHETEE